jgi:endonuclease/exonuclease/phosphatase (EEP) superfamily protein YafD
MRALLLALSLVAVARATPVKVLSWNVHGGREGLDRVVSELRASQARVFILQETGGEVGTKIAAQFPGWSKARTGDLMILSREDLEGQQVVKLGPGRSCLLARAGRLTLIDVHFSTSVGYRSLSNSGGSKLPAYLLHTGQVRREQAKALLDLIAAQSGSLIVAGDLNSTPQMEPPRMLSKGLTSAPTGPTFPATHPSGKIDYIFFSRDLRAKSSAALVTTASDHLPLYCELESDPQKNHQGSIQTKRIFSCSGT